jgi:predicted ABC-type transport system involved in lysophospholipase L1 biosynthesis ATPase subunit
MSSSILKLEQVTKRYPAPTGEAPLRVIDDVCLDVRPGETLAIVGPSGSGKSTLLHLMGGLDRPDSGTVTLDGERLDEMEEDRLAMVRNRKVGFVFQSHYLLPQCTVLENVLVPTLACRAASRAASGERAGERAARLLERVGLGGRLAHRPGQLSGGERQRVATVRALVNAPVLLLADEPTGSLDSASAATLADLLTELNREERVTLILATHSGDLAARMGRVLRLKQGHLGPERARTA